ncbi:transposase [Streptomyces sp. NPDC013457]|uniref:transposase n=1 Tax=Streptomyces sp. NPDC013457 TaxID=3364866 RepID=UPI0036FA5D23
MASDRAAVAQSRAADRAPGGKRHPGRLVFQGISYVLHTGIAWEHLPQEIGFGSGMTCWRRLATVWPRLHEVLLAKIRGANVLDFSQAAVDGLPHSGAARGPRRAEVPLAGAGGAARVILSPVPPASRSQWLYCAVTLPGACSSEATCPSLVPPRARGCDADQA